MLLIDLWNRNRSQLTDKHIRQIISIAGDGALTDSASAPAEFRDFLRHVHSDEIRRYIGECLASRFDWSGEALQDLVNEVGRRLGFNVTPGRYGGVQGGANQDGLWRFSDGHSVVVEVKTSDTYRIDIDKIAGYRNVLARDDELDLGASSMLIVVGRDETPGLEAQIRGSKHAWSMRVISADALVRLLMLREEADDPPVVHGIHGVLLPREFTRLDDIVKLLFSATEEARQALNEVTIDTDPADDATTERTTPAAFGQACVERIAAHLDVTLVRRSRVAYTTPDGAIALICLVSKYHEQQGRYWYAFHEHQHTFLEDSNTSYVALGYGSPDALFLIPREELSARLSELNVTQQPGRAYWHVHVRCDDQGKEMIMRRGLPRWDIQQHFIQADAEV